MATITATKGTETLTFNVSREEYGKFVAHLVEDGWMVSSRKYW